MRYDAFISYSHSADGRLAPMLQKALQQLAKPWFRRRSLEIFRDETGLGVDPHLWGSIVRALDDSEWFLLLASPQAADSVWVNREVEHWKANRSLDRMLPVLTEGHWQWDEQAGDFTADSDAVPPELRGVFIDEPRHLDLRWVHNAEQLDLRNSRFRDAVAEVAAPLHGRTKDDLEGEDVRQHRRTMRIASSAAAALTVLTVAAVVGAGIAVRNSNRAEQSRIRAESQRLAAQSGAELERPDLAFLLAAHGYRMNDNAQTRSALLTAVADMPEFKQRIPTDSPVTALATSAAADRIWIGTAAGDVAARRFSDGAEVGRIETRWNGEIVALAPARAGSADAVIAGGTTVATVDANLKPTVVRRTSSLIMALAVDSATGRVAAGTNTGDVVVWAADGSAPSLVFKAWGGEPSWASALTWTTDSALLVAGQNGRIRRFEPDLPGLPVWERRSGLAQETAWVSALTALGDGTVVVGGSDGTVGFLRASDGSATPAGQTALHAANVNALAATGDAPAQGSAVSVSDDGFLIFWNHLTGQPVIPPIRIDEQDATAVAWDPAKKSLGVAGGTAGGAVLLDYSPDRRRPLAKPVPGWTGAFAVGLSPASDRLAVATVVANSDRPTEPASRLTLTSAAQPDPSGPAVLVKGLITRIRFTPDGSRVLAGTTDGTVVIWDGTSGRPSVIRVGPAGALDTELAVAPDGATVATRTRPLASLDRAPTTVWRLNGLDLVAEDSIDGPFGSALAFTTDGSGLVIGGIDKVLIHRLDGKGDSRSVDISGDMSSAIAVAPDGTSLAIGLASGPVRLVDITSGLQAGDDLRVAAPVTDLAFSGDDELVATSADGSIVFWDVPSRTRLADKPLTAVARGPGGRTIRAQLAVGPDVAVTASGSDGLLVMWPLDPANWISEGCSVHGRELTDAESARYGLTGAAPICTGQR